MSRWPALKICALTGIWVCLLMPLHAQGANFTASASGGLMQQPTSNYYLACYGVNLDFQTKNGGFIARGSYVERPEYSRDGYTEKDAAMMLLAGTTAIKAYGGDIRAFLGGATVAGYVARSASATGQPETRRSYALPGPAASLEYAITFKKFVVAANHTTLIGFADQDQTSALVAWPFNFYTLSFGFTL